MTLEQDKTIEETMLRQMSQKSIRDRFNGKIESVTIEYELKHLSYTEPGVLRRQKTDAADFFIKCINHECTKRYFNLGDKVVSMYLKGETIFEGEETCSGQTAPDHPNQRCGGAISYKITLQYTESCL
jgi:hypothetical protein